MTGSGVVIVLTGAMRLSRDVCTQVVSAWVQACLVAPSDIALRHRWVVKVDKIML